MLNIKQFTADINKRGILRTNRYLTSIFFTKDHYMASNKNAASLLQIRCDSASLPGMSFSSADGPPRLGYGPVERHPYNVMFDEFTLSFIVDSDSEVHKILYDWANCIVNFKGKGGSDISGNNWDAYEVGYRDKYAATVTTEVYKEAGEGNDHYRAMTVTAYNAFPMGIPSTNMDWNSNDMMRIRIPFAYTDYKIDYDSIGEFNAGSPKTEPNPISVNTTKIFSTTNDTRNA